MTRLELLNHVANRAEVLSGIGGVPGQEAVDLAGFLKDPRNILLGDERGVLLFVYAAEGVYDMHYLFTDALRGRDALLATRVALHTLFTHYGATAICGSTPRENRAARAMNRALGAVPFGESTDLLGHPCIDYVLEREKWATLSAE